MDGFRFSLGSIRAGLYPCQNGQKLAFSEEPYWSRAEGNDTVCAGLGERLCYCAQPGQVGIRCTEQDWYLAFAVRGDGADAVPGGSAQGAAPVFCRGNREPVRLQPAAEKGPLCQGRTGPALFAGGRRNHPAGPVTGAGNVLAVPYVPQPVNSRAGYSRLHAGWIYNSADFVTQHAPPKVSSFRRCIPINRGLRPGERTRIRRYFCRLVWRCEHNFYHLRSKTYRSCRNARLCCLPMLK